MLIATLIAQSRSQATGGYSSVPGLSVFPGSLHRCGSHLFPVRSTVAVLSRRAASVVDLRLRLGCGYGSSGVRTVGPIE
jgi:hypothetical protein